MVHQMEGAMTHLCRTVLAALAVALCAAPVAAADGKHGHDGHAAVVPVHKIAGAPAGEVFGQEWMRFYEAQPGDTDDPCEITPGRRPALTIGPQPQTSITCSVPRRTQVVLYSPGTACSDLDPDPYNAADEAAQRECAARADYQWVQSLQASVDGSPPVQFRRPRYEIFTPQVTAEVPEDNLGGLPAGTAHLVGHQWAAQTRKLRPGQHTVTLDTVTTDFTVTNTYILNIGGDGRHPAKDD
jgi:hypothetical protein